MNENFIGERIKNELGSRKQKWLAEATGIGEVTICRYIKGERIPRSHNLKKIAKALNVSVDFLLGAKCTSEYDKGYAQGLNHAFAMKENADGCFGCAFEDVNEWEMPCAKCKRNSKDYWRAKTVK